MFFVLFQHIFPRYFFLRITFILLGLFFLPSLTHASITPSLSPSRTTGVAPLSVFFDASSTTASTTTLPFHELDYSWNFGDDDNATWTYGSNPGINKKNRAYGPESAHVFETPGTYTVTLNVFDGTDTVTTTQVITVTDPDTVFSGTNTTCFANNTTYTGCPAGATQTGNTSALSLATCTAGRRCLFKRGDTYTTDAQTFSAAGSVTIGAYGSGTQPIFSRTSETVTAINIASTNVNDLRIMDIEITGASTSSSDGGACITVSAMPTNITMLRLVCHDIGKGIINTGSNGMTGSIIQDSHIYNIGATSGGVGIYGKFIQSAILGNSVGPFNTTAEHNVRVQPGRHVVVSHNTITTPGNTGKAVLTIRASDHLTGLDLDPVNDTQYVYISDNKLMGGASSVQMFQIAPASNSQNDWIYDVIAERNWIVFGSVAQQGLFTEGTRLTARNNICDATGGANGRTCFNNDHRNTAGVPVPDDNRFYNNTCYSGDVSGNLQCVTLGAFGSQTITNSVVKNNLGYAPNATVAKLLYLATPSDGITGTIGASGTFGNSSDIQVSGTNPFPIATPTTLSDFVITTGSYAIASSTTAPVYRDFYSNFRSATPDMGAFNLDSTSDNMVFPQVTLTSPLSGESIFGSQVYLSATATDDGAVAGVQFKLDGVTSIGNEVTYAPYVTTLDTSGLSGSHTIVAVARDNSGNYTTSTAATVTVSDTGMILITPGVGFGGATAQPENTGSSLSGGYDENAIARFDVVPYQAFSDTLNVGVVAFHVNGIQKVSFSVNGGSWVDVTDMTRNPDTNVVEYWATLRATDFSDGQIEVRAIVYPNTGVPRVLQGAVTSASQATGNFSLWLYANSGGIYDTSYVYVSPLTGNDTTGNGTFGNPYLSLYKALDMVQNGQTIRLLDETEYVVPTVVGGPRYAFPYDYANWTTVEADPSVDPNKVIVKGGDGRWRINRIRLHNLSFDMINGGAYINAEWFAWADHVRFFDSAGWSHLSDGPMRTSYTAGVYSTGSSANNMQYGFTGFSLVRNSLMRYISNDAFTNSRVVLNSNVERMDLIIAGTHNDVHQYFGSALVPLVENIIVYGEVSTDIAATQDIFLDHTNSSFRDMAFVNINIQNIQDPADPPFSQLASPERHLFFQNIELPNQKLFFRTDLGAEAYVPTYVVMKELVLPVAPSPIPTSTYIVDSYTTSGTPFGDAVFDVVVPTLTESTPIATSTDTTPDYTFSATEAGSLTYGGDCTSSTTTATSGSNTITFSTLSVGTHTNCTITATDSSSNPSTPLAVTSFTITAPTVTSSSSSSSSSKKKKKKKKKISSKITYKKGERVAPYITLLTPKKGTIITKSFAVKASASDRSGIQAMFVSVNGTKKKRANNVGSILYTAKKLKNATVSVSAYDTLGNVKSASITITNGKVSGVRYY